MRFWDSSALVSLLIHESRAPLVADLFAQDPAKATWWGAPVECDSALHRAARAGRIRGTQLADSLVRLESLLSASAGVPPADVVRNAARNLIRRHPLSACDSLQLAAAVAWAEGSPAGFAFVCLDDRLRAAAQAEGFRALPA